MRPLNATRAVLRKHAREEEAHLDLLTERINQLGGKPHLNPARVSARAASQEVEGETLVEMIEEDLVAERIAIETYRDLVSYFGDRDPTTRILLEKILAQEEEHANDMHDLLVAHQGHPMLDR
jgi:bacterioferritin